MLDLYYHLTDEESCQAMLALAVGGAQTRVGAFNGKSPFEGNLRATGQSKIEKTLEVLEVQELLTCLSDLTERAGFEPAVRKNRTLVFETSSISRSDTSPAGVFYIRGRLGNSNLKPAWGFLHYLTRYGRSVRIMGRLRRPKVHSEWLQH